MKRCSYCGLLPSEVPYGRTHAYWCKYDMHIEPVDYETKIFWGTFAAALMFIIGPPIAIAISILFQ